MRVEIRGIPPSPEKHPQEPRISSTLPWTQQRVRLSSEESRVKDIRFTDSTGNPGDAAVKVWSSGTSDFEAMRGTKDAKRKVNVQRQPAVCAMPR